MFEGVRITAGIKNWQIFQQIDGYAEISFSGHCDFSDDHNGDVYARVVDENTQSTIVSWTKAEMGENYKYRLTFPKVPAGGLYRIETTFSENDCYFDWTIRGDMIYHIGVGDLYVIAGQSNSAGYGKTPATDMPELGIHLYRNCEEWDLAVHPMNDSTNTRHPINAEGGNPGHSPYLAFAKKVRYRMHYPIGLIQTSLGGSSIYSWDSNGQNNLYTNMIDVIDRATNGRRKVKGILWYQGCSDACLPNCDEYFERFKIFTESARCDTGNDNLFILTVQLNKWLDGAGNADANHGWGRIREVQRQVAKNLRGVYVIPTADLGLSDGIHNNTAANIVIGERLGTIALEKIYGLSERGSAPDLNRAYFVSENKIRLEFDNIYQQIEAITMDINQMPFAVYHDGEKVEIIGYSWNKDFCELTINGNADEKYTVNCASGTAPYPYIPFDRGSGLPLLGFYNIKVINL